jgi:hypothetical protein
LASLSTWMMISANLEVMALRSRDISVERGR